MGGGARTSRGAARPDAHSRGCGRCATAPPAPGSTALPRRSLSSEVRESAQGRAEKRAGRAERAEAGRARGAGRERAGRAEEARGAAAAGASRRGSCFVWPRTLALGRAAAARSPGTCRGGCAPACGGGAGATRAPVPAEQPGTLQASQAPGENGCGASRCKDRRNKPGPPGGRQRESETRGLGW